MLQHLVIKTKHPVELGRRMLDWRAFIHDKRDPVRTFIPAIDAVVRAHGLGFWLTREYAARDGSRWSPEEIAAGLDRIYRLVLHTRSPSLPRALIDGIRLHSDVEYARPLLATSTEIIRARAPPLQTDTSRDSIRLREAHTFGVGKPGVRVAVLDTGIDMNHPELRGRIAGGVDVVSLQGLDTADFIGDFVKQDQEPDDEVGHGSHVSGIIAGRGEQIPIGVAPASSILAVRVLATMSVGGKLFGAGIPDNINAGIKWAVDHGADVINMSLGVKNEGGGLPHHEVIQYALARGVTVVAASGNDGTAEKYYPGALRGVIAVGAGDAAGNAADFTSFGAPVWILAPGTDVLSSYAHGRYAYASGTSQAAPFVAGAVALLKAQAKSFGVTLGDREIKEILTHTSDRPDRRLRTPRSGCGSLNVLDACRLLQYRFGSAGQSPRTTISLRALRSATPVHEARALESNA